MSANTSTGSLYTSITNHIATIEFGHVSSNSFTIALLNRLTDSLYELSSNDDVHLILLKSEGEKAFCAGASFDELLAVNNPAEGEQFFSGFANLINAMRKCSKIIVGRIQGKTVGGGVGLIAACDYVFATEAASIRLSELSIGIAPLVIAPALVRKMGTAAVSEVSLSPTEWKSAYWAQEKGLYAKVFETISDMDKELDFYTEQLASYNVEALTAWKKVLWDATDNWDFLLTERAKITGSLALSEVTRTALAKFKNN